MSKIAEKRAFEAYPVVQIKMCGDGMYDIHAEHRECYKQGYEQCQKDIIDKVCRWVSYNIDNYIDTQNDSEGYACEVFLERKFVDDFKKAME